MLSPLRNRFGIPGVISVIALVFAMLGGAYAASDDGSPSNATASAKKKNKKAKRGPRGPRGKRGLTGPAGPAGAQGPAGANGSDGAQGLKGDKGDKGDQGPKGATGPEGHPWTLGGTLPENATLTGSWSILIEGEQLLPISFNVPLAAGLGEAAVHKTGDSEFATVCPGTAADPQAESGHLCVYTAGTAFGPPEVVNIFSTSAANSETVGASKSGAMLLVGGVGAIWGTWAVTG